MVRNVEVPLRPLLLAKHADRCYAPDRKFRKCVASRSECLFDPSGDKRRKLPLRLAQNKAKKLSNNLQHLISLLRDGTDEEVQNLRRDIQETTSKEGALQLIANRNKTPVEGEIEEE
ncbi:hypothetical protein BBP40_010242 [Aspergillus hancockii]|nr:hypothetical protein BBP40_010242 [Aspergillus hancockii]